jgi:hypothetical protein
MKETSKIYYKVIAGVVLGIFSFYQFATLSLEEFSGIKLITGLFAFIALAYVIGPFISGNLGTKAGRSIFYPSSGSLPIVGYSKAKAYKIKRLYNEAFLEYEQISLQHPKELIPYLEMIEIALEQFNNPSITEKIYAQAKGSLDNEKNISSLKRQYEEGLGKLDK